MSEITLSREKCPECGMSRLNIDGACSVEEQNQLINSVVKRWEAHDALVEALRKIAYWREAPFSALSIDEAGNIALEALKLAKDKT